MITTCLFLSFSYIGYFSFGSPTVISKYYSDEITSGIKKNSRLRVLYNKLQQDLIINLAKIDKDPKDDKAWWSLAKIYELKADTIMAEDAWDNLYKLKPDNLNNLINWLQFNLKNNNGILNEYALEELKSVNNSYYNEPALINILLINEYNKENYEMALTYLQRIKALSKVNIAEKQKIEINNFEKIIKKKINK